MPEKTPGFPVGPVLTLFVVVGLVMLSMISGQPQSAPATPKPPTVVAVAPTTAAQSAQTEAVGEAAPTTVTNQTTGQSAEGAQPQAVTYTDKQVMQGRTLFGGTCAACHGPDAHGIPGLGKNLATSTFVHGLSDNELLAFIIKGRPVTDPLNTTGVAMPPRGANPSLTDDQLHLIIDFIRSQQVKEGTSGAAPAPTAIPGNAAATKPFVLPIQSLGLDTTPTKAFELPINSLNLGTATPAPGGEATSVPTLPPTAVPTTAPTQPTSPTATDAGGFQLPINSLNLATATPSQ